MIRHALLTVSLIALLAGSTQAQEATPIPASKQAVKETTPPADYVIAKIDGEPVRFSEVDVVWNQFFGGSGAPDFNQFDEKIKQSVLREVISKRLVYKDAVAQGYDKNAEVQKRLEEIKRQVVLQVYVEDRARGLATDERLKAAYEEKIKQLADVEEVHARHILVASEQEAKTLQKQLKKGGDFAAIAKEKSDDKGSGAKGGDLGYFTKDKMIPEFSAVAFAMKKGEISEPVKSEFGWHIIKVEDRRKAPVPTFEESRASLRESIVNKELDGVLAGLMEKSKITYYGPDGKEKPFEKKPVKAAKTDDKKPLN